MSPARIELRLGGLHIEAVARTDASKVDSFCCAIIFILARIYVTHL